MIHKSIALCIGLVALVSTTALYAGPPLICHPLNIGSAESLPFGKEPFQWDAHFKVAQLNAKTLALLTPRTPVLVRMETIRRAVVYAGRSAKDNHEGVYSRPENKRRAASLLRALDQRLVKADPKTGEYAEYLFDRGYLTAALHQAGLTESTSGLGDIKKAIAMLHGNGSMEFALALICVDPPRGELRSHLTRAKIAAVNDPLLARNIETRFHNDKYSIQAAR